MAVDMFIKIDGIDGESTAHKHKGEIEAFSFSWGLTNTGHASGGGGGAGKVNVQDLSFIAAVSSASPKLMEACCTGQHIRDVTLTFATRETKQEYLKIKLSDCLISSYQTGAGGGSVPTDQVSFNFSSVDIQAANRQGQFEQVSCDFGGGKLVDGGLKHNH
mgnify:CR=1 FL=1